jgi:SAM domain (Sterile alpha motif)
MQDLAHWLEQLGMSEYAERFAENGINFAALRYLTDQDLKDIGVLLGHRRIILGAINELASVGPAKTDPAAKPADASANVSRASTPAASPAPTTEASGERRQVTGDVLRSGRVYGAFRAYGPGRGDGVIVYFGYPQAHEDDAERAVRAGLELMEAVDGAASSLLDAVLPAPYFGSNHCLILA